MRAASVSRLRCGRGYASRTRVLALAVVMLTAAAAAVPAHAAAPRHILITGPELKRPAVLSTWNENLRLFTVLLSAKRPKAGWQRDRPRYGLALFWGVPARPPTDPDQANQHGWFYPAIGGRRAVVELVVDGQDPRRVAPTEALRILARHGVPTRVRLG